MSKENNQSKSDKVKPSLARMQFSATKLEKLADQTEVNVPLKEIFSQELIIRLTDRIKKI